MTYSVVKRANPIDKSSEPLYYAQPVWSNEISLRTIAQQISKYSTLTLADVSAVLASFIEMLPIEKVGLADKKAGDGKNGD